MDGLKWKTLSKWMIWGYPYFWKHPNSHPNSACLTSSNPPPLSSTHFSSYSPLSTFRKTWKIQLGIGNEFGKSLAMFFFRISKLLICSRLADIFFERLTILFQHHPGSACKNDKRRQRPIFSWMTQKIILQDSDQQPLAWTGLVNQFCSRKIIFETSGAT